MATLAIRIDDDLLNGVRDIVFRTPELTLTAFTVSAIKQEIKARERVNGGKFKPRTGEIDRGRPTKGQKK